MDGATSDSAGPSVVVPEGVTISGICTRCNQINGVGQENLKSINGKMVSHKDT